MNRPYNFRMPPNLTGDQYGMMARPIPLEPPMTARPIPPMPPADGGYVMMSPIPPEPPIRDRERSPIAPASETFGSLDISDPYMRELMRQYYVPPAPVRPLSEDILRSRYPIVIPAEQTTQPSSYMRDLMRNYTPTMPQIPSMPAGYQLPPQTQSNAFFTL